MMPGRIEFGMDFKKSDKKPTNSGNSAMNILIMGDFTGFSLHSAVKDLSIVRIDVDNYSQIMAKFSPTLELNLSEPSANTTQISFQKLDDFHPDTLYTKLDMFLQLKNIRDRLLNPSTFDDAAAELQANSTPQAVLTSSKLEQIDDSDSTFENLLGSKPANISSQATSIDSTRSVDISSFIKKVVEPDIVRAAPKQQEALVALVDKSTSEVMRKILHNENFQKLEANWRSVYECINRLDDDENLNIYVLNVSKNALLSYADSSKNDVAASPLYQSIVEECVQTLGGQAWSLMLGLYDFTNDDGDIELLNYLAELASHSGGPFLSSANASVVGCDDLHEQSSVDDWRALDEDAAKRWDWLRQRPYAAWVGLVLPRFLLRMSYGKQGEEIDRFEFEEISKEVKGSENHNQFLWGNPAVVTAVLAAQTYQNNEGFTRLGEFLELDDFPIHIYEQDGEKTMKPCAEVVMSERTAQAIIKKGIMPLMCYKNKNTVRLMCFQSLSETDPNLQGPWR